MKISKTAIFLFELMIVILVFTVAAAICMNIFVKAYGFSRESKDITMSVLRAESAAETFKSTGEPAEETTYFYDKAWQPTDNTKEATYAMTLTPSDEGSLSVLGIDITDKTDDTKIYDLTVKKYGQSY